MWPIAACWEALLGSWARCCWATIGQKSLVSPVATPWGLLSMNKVEMPKVCPVQYRDQARGVCLILSGTTEVEAGRVNTVVALP